MSEWFKALPSGVGTLNGRESAHVMLIWRLPPEIGEWSKVKPATFLLMADYEDDGKNDSLKHITQKMIGEVAIDKECDLQNPPSEEYTFGIGSGIKKVGETTQTATEQSPSRVSSPVVAQEQKADAR
ncbi:unnamed protein product [Anisakis simplex]|uniref:Phage_base_V domain-containing protein n=1 Tax=Anisakis simplex TaxID=6269 RepID=A0A0M3J732_ANISI|nr:unnamed protein product [Anisakis simplex]